MGRHAEHPQGILAQLEPSPEKGPPGRASGTQRKPVKESALRLGWPNKVHSRHSFLAASVSGAFGLLQGCLSVGHSLVVCMLGSSARLTTLDNKLANQAIPGSMSVDFLAWIKASQKHTARTEEFYKVGAAPGPCTLAASPLHFRTSCRHLWMGTCTTRMNLQASAARYVLALAHAVCPSSCICLRTSKSATPARLSEGSWRSALRLPMRKQKRQDCAA